MKRKILLLFLLNVIIFNVFSQKQISIGKSCSYYGEKIPAKIFTFSSDADADAAIRLITDAAGLAPNFIILAGDVPNACAVSIYNNRYIIYNQTFLYNITKRINYWGSLSILAHEIGHHLNGHTLLPGGSRPSIELEADKYSGFILAKLGASLDDAQSAINNLASDYGSETHPPKSARLAAIANGWYQAGGQNNSSNNSNEIINYSTNIGDKLPDFYQSDPNGQTIKLSSFRGKYVLVDFWASWCGPCRGENPNVVNAFKRYRSKNFTILGVSLDKSRGPWLQAIADDGLTWTHVSDLKGWSNAVAQKLIINSIPQNFLLDPNGVIIGKNLRGDDLINALYQVLY